MFNILTKTAMRTPRKVKKKMKRLIGDFKTHQSLMFKDLIIFGGCAYYYPSFRHIPYLEAIDKL